MARLTPMVQGETLTWYVDTHEHQLAVGTPAWYSWLQEASLFAFVAESGSFTARKEMKPHGATYWKAYRKRGGRLYHAYLGKSEQLTLERLNAIAVRLARRGEGEETPSAQEFAQETLPESTAHDITVVTRPASNLPVPLTSLIGREQERAGASSLLRRPEVRLLTLTGTGGIGKTRLALQVATDLLTDFADGVCFVSLAPVSDPDLVVPTIVQMLGLKDSGGQPLLNLLKAYLSDKHLLLLLDNFEQVVVAAPQLSELLIACPHLKILVTSRAVLHLRGEHEFPVPPLALPDLTQLPESETLSQVAAVALFLQRASAIQPNLPLTSPNARAIAQICVQLDGLPLAIELAAARSKLLPPQALLARLGQRLAVLTSGARDVPERQQTLRNTIAWSYHLLEEQEQRLFRRISVFVGGCTLEAIEAIGTTLDGDLAVPVLDAVASLIDKSLLQQASQEGEEVRLVMLETIREYGLECLAASGEMEATRQAHALCYLALTEEAELQFDSPQQAVWLERLEREHDNLRAAMQWLLEQEGTEQRREMALRLGAALQRFWDVRGHWSEGRSFLERALARSEGVAVPVRAKAIRAAADLARIGDDLDRGEVLCEQCLALYREFGDKQGAAYSLYLLGELAWRRSNYAAARSRIEESLAFWREVDEGEGIAWSLLTLGDVASEQGEYTRGRSLYEQSLALHKELGNKRGVAFSLFGLASVLFFSQSDPATIHSLLKESLTLFRELGHKVGIALALGLLGQMFLLQGDAATARSLLEERAVISREIGIRWSTAQSLSLLARAAASEGDYAAAHAFYEESLEIAKKVGNKWLIASCLEGLAGVVAAQGEPAWAARLWGAAEALRDAIGAPLPPVYHADYDRSVAAARTHLRKKAFATAWAEGRAMTPEQALAAQGPVTMPERLSVVPQPTTREKTSPTYPAGLTAREVEVLRLVAQGLTDAEVAEQLVISPRTVNWHLTSIYSKLQVTSRSAATRYAIEHHLI